MLWGWCWTGTGKGRATPTSEVYDFAMAFGALLRRRRVASWELEVFLEHATRFSEVRREVLNIFHCCFWYVQTHLTYTVLNCWRTCEKIGFRTSHGVGAVLLERRLGTPTCIAGDASLTGYGIKPEPVEPFRRRSVRGARVGAPTLETRRWSAQSSRLRGGRVRS